MLLLYNIDKLALSYSFVDAFAHHMVGSNALTNTAPHLVEPHMDNLNDESRLEGMLDHQAKPDGIVRSKDKIDVLTQPTHSPPEIKSGSKLKSCYNQECSDHAKSS